MREWRRWAATTTLLLLSGFRVVAAAENGLRGRDGLNATKVSERKLQSRAPKFTTDKWTKIKKYPVNPWVGEAQGAVMGKYLVVAGGFSDSVYLGTTKTYGLDMSKSDANWEEWADVPVDFWTHAGHATKGTQWLFLCGGYFGAHPGDEMADCYQFNRFDGPKGKWSKLPFLPQGRGGGALLYIEVLDSLVFTLGATRKPNQDEETTWILDLKKKGDGWKYIGKSPYKGNHVSAIHAYDCSGKVHYFVMGGQKTENEGNGNKDQVYEFIPGAKQFVARKFMPKPKGHFTPAITPYGCGFIAVGGAINGGTSTDEVIYYDIDDDKWTVFGKYTKKIKTPVCGAYNDVLTCTTGYTTDGFKRSMSFPYETEPTPTPPTPTPPTPTPPTPTPPTPTSATPPSGSDVTGLTLIDADKNSAIMEIKDGMEIDTASLSATKFNIRADIAAGAVVGSVSFTSSPQITNPRTESVAPFALAGDSGGNYNGVELKAGSYTVTATPYTEQFAGGSMGTPHKTSFSVL